MTDGGSAMYPEAILARYRSPENHGFLDPNTVSRRGENPLCGDDLEFSIIIEAGAVDRAKFRGQGCAIAQASADILLSHVAGSSVETVLAMADDELIEVLGIEPTPLRRKCALLALCTVRDALRSLRGEGVADSTRME